MIIVTGGAGFIGSNIVRDLNARGQRDILVVDDLSDGRKFFNLASADIADYMDKKEFLALVQNNHDFGAVEAVVHQGACSTTTEWDGRMMMQNNYRYSVAVLHFCQARNIPFIYASSAAVYGNSKAFSEQPGNEQPLNVYGYSKLLFDQYVRRMIDSRTAPVVGLRYFNVYGPNEQHKSSMASVAFHFNQQIIAHDECRLFAQYDGYAAGEQRRDFVYVGDVCNVIAWLLENPQVAGIYNLGTGSSQTFNDIANAVIQWHGHGKIKYIPFPDHLQGSYQSFTEADISLLRAAGYTRLFANAEQGVSAYLSTLAEHRTVPTDN